jgi:hypothetical protein
MGPIISRSAESANWRWETDLPYPPGIDQFWIIDCRIFVPETDPKSKLDHMREMLANAVHHKRLPFRVVLMDTWPATPEGF